MSLQLYVYSGLEPECESWCDRCFGYGLFVNWYTAGFSKWATSHQLKLIKRPPQDVDAPKEEPKPKRQRRNRWGQDRAAAKCSTRNCVRHGWSMVGAARNTLFLACFEGTWSNACAKRWWPRACAIGRCRSHSYRVPARCIHDMLAVIWWMGRHWNHLDHLIFLFTSSQTFIWRTSDARCWCISFGSLDCATWIVLPADFQVQQSFCFVAILGLWQGSPRRSLFGPSLCVGSPVVSSVGNSFAARTETPQYLGTINRLWDKHRFLPANWASSNPMPGSTDPCIIYSYDSYTCSPGDFWLMTYDPQVPWFVYHQGPWPSWLDNADLVWGPLGCSTGCKRSAGEGARLCQGWGPLSVEAALAWHGVRTVIQIFYGNHPILFKI